MVVPFTAHPVYGDYRLAALSVPARYFDCLVVPEGYANEPTGRGPVAVRSRFVSAPNAGVPPRIAERMTASTEEATDESRTSTECRLLVRCTMEKRRWRFN